MVLPGRRVTQYQLRPHPVTSYKLISRRATERWQPAWRTIFISVRLAIRVWATRPDAMLLAVF